MLVHCVTRKGNGYRPAEDDEADRLHGVGIIDPASGRPLAAAGPRSWTSVFSEEMVRAGAEHPDVVAITAAMLQPVGLQSFAARWPDRVFDVGIAEQHAVTSAAGLAMGGLRPVVCVYATFMNRAFDQVLLDVALHRLPVTFVLDRAGVTGDDGPSHHGMWDLGWMQLVPGLAVAAPRDEPTLRAEFAESLSRDDGPCVLRFPKGAVGPDLPALRGVAGVDVLWEPHPGPVDVLVICVGGLAATCIDVADRVVDQGISVRVVDPRWVKPVNPVLVDLARLSRLVVTVEDGGRAGGVGSAVAQALRDNGLDVPLRDYGLPQQFLGHGKRDEILAEAGLTSQDLARRIVEAAAWQSGRGLAAGGGSQAPVVPVPPGRSERDEAAHDDSAA